MSDMIRPTSRKSMSRRSSVSNNISIKKILKAPVVQQPLQHMTVNVSVHQESSSTIKQKRRVSFADKKHIKEFCDSVEQGTLWDITYEESSSEHFEQSNLSNQNYKTINTDDQDVNEDKITNENENVINNSLDFTEPMSSMASFKIMRAEEPLIKKSRSILCQNTDKTKDNATINICTDKNIVVYNDTLSLNDTDNAELNKTCAEDISMEITEIPYIIKSKNIVPIIHKELSEDKENIPISNISDKTQHVCTEQLEFTECLQSEIKPAEWQEKLPEANDKELNNQKTQIFQDVPMEITCAIPSINRKNVIDQTIIFHDTPMDSTMVVTSILNEKEIATPIDIPEIESDKVKLLHVSMELTNNICSLPFSKTIDVTANDKDTLNYKYSSIHHNKNTQLRNDAIELTTATANLPQITELNKCIRLDQTRLSSEKTKIFQDESMAITELVHTPKTLFNNDNEQMNDILNNSLVNNEDLMSSKTQIFQDESMAITELVNTPKTLHNNDIEQINDISNNSPVNNEVLMSSKTQIFQDESMAITELVNTPKTLHNNDIEQINDISNNSPVNNEVLMSSTTQIFQDESMAITELVNTPKTLLNNDIEQINDISNNSPVNNEVLMSSTTQIFQDESMAITELVHTSKTLLNNDNEQMNDISNNSPVNNEVLMSSTTQIFQDESMPITAPLCIPKNLDNDIQKLNNVLLTNPLKNNEDVVSFKKQIVQNESIIITTPLYASNSLQNNGIEHRNNEDITSMHTRIFQNMSMEITNAITNLPILPNSRKSCECTSDYGNSNITENEDKATVDNASTSRIINDTANSCTTNYSEDFENSNTELKPVNALTSLISSFVYADMIEDDSFIKAINEHEHQSMQNNIEQNNINTKSAVDTVNLEVDEDNNIQEENIVINRTENNNYNSKRLLHESIEVHEDVFEQSIIHETMCGTSEEEIEMIKRNKQLDETKKDIEDNSKTYIKSKKNSVMDVNKYIADPSSNDEINNRSSILSPTLLSASIKNKVSIAETNLITDLTDDINLNNFYEKEKCHSSSLNEAVEHVTSNKKPTESSTFEKGTFSSLIHQLKKYIKSNDCIWDLYFEDIDKQIIVVSFISTSLLIMIFTQYDVDSVTCPIKHIDIISRLENAENVQLSIAHKLIKEKINVKYVDQLYKYDEGVVSLLNHISEDVKLVLDFIFDLKQLDDTNLMDIDTERITFIVRSKYMNIVLEITMDVILFDKIDSSNINIVCILGTIRKEDIKELITNIKRDHKFLRRLMSDIKGYIDIMEQADLANRKSCS